MAIGNWWDSTGRNLRLAVRTLARTPLFAVTVILTLAYLLAFFSLAALSLACLGLYGTLSYLVHIRRRETALRLALGADPRQVLKRVVARGLRVAVPGCVVGLALTAGLGRVLSGMLYGVWVYDPVTLAGVVAMVIAVSVGASLAPALRASRLDPMCVLREE